MWIEVDLNETIKQEFADLFNLMEDLLFQVLM